MNSASINADDNELCLDCQVAMKNSCYAQRDIPVRLDGSSLVVVQAPDACNMQASDRRSSTHGNELAISYCQDFGHLNKLGEGTIKAAFQLAEYQCAGFA
jgi:hypothetical protein